MAIWCYRGVTAEPRDEAPELRFVWLGAHMGIERERTQFPVSRGASINIYYVCAAMAILIFPHAAVDSN